MSDLRRVQHLTRTAKEARFSRNLLTSFYLLSTLSSEMPSFPSCHNLFTRSKKRWASLLCPHPEHEPFMAEGHTLIATTKASKLLPTLFNYSTRAPIPPFEEAKRDFCESAPAVAAHRNLKFDPRLIGQSNKASRSPLSATITLLIIQGTYSFDTSESDPQSPGSPAFVLVETGPAAPRLHHLYFDQEPLVDLSQGPMNKYFPQLISHVSSAEVNLIMKSRYRPKRKESEDPSLPQKPILLWILD